MNLRGVEARALWHGLDLIRGVATAALHRAPLRWRLSQPDTHLAAAATKEIAISVETTAQVEARREGIEGRAEAAAEGA